MKSWYPAVIAALAGLVGCAHVESPTGGPDMRTPLELMVVRPDSLEVVAPFRGPVVFTYHRRLSEQGLRDAVVVSPETSPVVVSHSGRELRVSLRNGWEPNRIYHVTALPTFQDLWSNRPTGRSSIVFSTGPDIPDTRVAGEAIDRITGRPEVGIRVEAIRAADSLVYATVTDSAGAFTLDRIPEGDYLLRAFQDLNRNRALDEFEPRDSAHVAVAEEDSAAAFLRVVQPDTTPPVAQSAQLARGEIEVRFDDHLDPEQSLDLGQVEIIDATGLRVPVARLAVGRLPALEPEADTADVVAAPVPQIPPTPPALPGPPGPPGRGEPAEADTARGPLPSQALSIETAEPLVPGTEYTIHLRGIVNVVGLAGDSEVTLSVSEDADLVDPDPTPDPDLDEDEADDDVEDDDNDEDDAGAEAAGAAHRQTTYSLRSGP